MKLPELIFYLMPLLMAGCQGAVTQTGKQPQSDTIKPAKTGTAKVHAPIFTPDSAIINNEFANNVLAFGVFKADTVKIKSLFLNPVILKLVKQKGPQGNCLYNFTDGINKLSLVYNNDFYLEDGEVKNGKVLLNKKLSIGMAKGDFLKLINVAGIKRDTVIVKDDELSFESVYIFSNSRLKEIDMGQIVE